jgi:hypothetical protein
MKIELADVTGLPAAFQSLVSEADGKHVLDLAQVATEFDRFKGKALTAEQESIERRKALKAWEAFGTPDEVQAKLAKGVDPAILQQLQAKAAENEAGYQSKLSALMTKQTMSELKAELAKAGVVPEGLDLLANFGAARVKFNDDGSVKITTADGATPMIGQGANGGATLADLAKQLAESIPHLVADNGKGGGGKPPGSSGGTPSQKTVTRAQFDAMSQTDRAAHSKSGGKVVD